MSLPNPVNYHIYTGQMLYGPKLYDYIIAGDGVIKVAAGPHFSAHVPICTRPIAGLRPYGFVEGDVRLAIPKIPAKWLYTVLAHARQAGVTSSVALLPIEQMYHFHWIESQWRVAVPAQQASAGQVSYHGGNEVTVVLDLHSHHRMDSFFSQTDDADEQGFRFYGVIGRIYTQPEIRLRVGVYGDWLELDPLVLFEGLGPFREAG